MSESEPSTSVHTIPESELFWAVLPAAHPASAAVHTRAPTQILRHTEELDERFAEFLPIGIETVKTAYVAIDGGRTLAAAVTRVHLTSLAAPGVIAATPASVPASIVPGLATGDLAARLNFLWGDTEAPRVLAAKRRAALTAAAAIMLLTAVALIGLERRAAAHRASAALHQSQTEATLKDLYRKPAEAALAALDLDLARLTRTRAPRSASPRDDASDALQSLLAAWPRPAQGSGATLLRTDSLTATPGSLTLTVALEDPAGSTPLSDALRAIPGWTLLQPRFTAAPLPSAGATTAKDAGTLSLSLTADARAVHVDRPTATREGVP